MNYFIMHKCHQTLQFTSKLQTLCAPISCIWHKHFHAPSLRSYLPSDLRDGVNFKLLPPEDLPSPGLLRTGLCLADFISCQVKFTGDMGSLFVPKYVDVSRLLLSLSSQVDHESIRRRFSFSMVSELDAIFPMQDLILRSSSSFTSFVVVKSKYQLCVVFKIAKKRGCVFCLRSCGRLEVWNPANSSLVLHELCAAVSYRFEVEVMRWDDQSIDQPTSIFKNQKSN